VNGGGGEGAFLCKGGRELGKIKNRGVGPRPGHYNKDRGFDWALPAAT
jgi:hypothetical protein